MRLGDVASEVLRYKVKLIQNYTKKCVHYKTSVNHTSHMKKIAKTEAGPPLLTT